MTRALAELAGEASAAQAALAVIEADARRHKHAAMMAGLETAKLRAVLAGIVRGAVSVDGWRGVVIALTGPQHERLIRMSGGAE